jgi:hypothetical protein
MNLRGKSFRLLRFNRLSVDADSFLVSFWLPVNVKSRLIKFLIIKELPRAYFVQKINIKHSTLYPAIKQQSAPGSGFFIVTKEQFPLLVSLLRLFPSLKFSLIFFHFMSHFYGVAINFYKEFILSREKFYVRCISQIFFPFLNLFWFFARFLTIFARLCGVSFRKSKESSVL